MLELFEPRGAFEKLERWLADEVPPGGEADVYLGYGLAAPLLRRTEPPPEPCPLPLLAARVREPRPSRSHGCRVGAWQPTWSHEEYAQAVERVRAAIAVGDVYQVNLVQHLAAELDGDPRSLADTLGVLRPLHGRALSGRGPAGERWTIVSASPELFLRRRGDRLVTMPIKGTRPAGVDVDDPKDAAEHTMIVDLERNDLARVCMPGSIRWPELMRQHELAGVTHLVSTVEGRLQPGVGLAEILDATFPGGSVTGAPKRAALELIAELEPVGRGASMGAIGTVRADGDFDLALTIRTFAVADGVAHLWVGGGIVWDSDADAEVEESWVKARPLLAAVGGAVAA